MLLVFSKSEIQVTTKLLECFPDTFATAKSYAKVRLRFGQMKYSGGLDNAARFSAFGVRCCEMRSWSSSTVSSRSDAFTCRLLYEQ